MPGRCLLPSAGVEPAVALYMGLVSSVTIEMGLPPLP